METIRLHDPKVAILNRDEAGHLFEEAVIALLALSEAWAALGYDALCLIGASLLLIPAAVMIRYRRSRAEW